MTCYIVIVSFHKISRLHYLCLEIIAMISLKDPRFQNIEPESVKICKFPKPGKNMKREMSNSLVSKAGTISLTTFERKGQSQVSTLTRPIGRAEIHYICSYGNIAIRLLVCSFLKPKGAWCITIYEAKVKKVPMNFLYAHGKVWQNTLKACESRYNLLLVAESTWLRKYQSRPTLMTVHFLWNLSNLSLYGS